MRLRFTLSTLVLVAACGRQEPPPILTPTTAVPEATAATTAVPTTTPAVAPKPPAAPLLADVPRTKPPTIAEWKDAKKVTVTDAQFLGCISEQVREWVRVSCREKSILGFPQSVTVVRGKGADVLTFAKWYANNSVASVQFRYGRGVSLEALFVFQDDSKNVIPLKVEWPESVHEAPAALGRFVGVPHISADQHAQACGCIAAQEPDCTLGSIRAGCLRLFESGSCERLMQCALGHRPHTGYAKCAEGEVDLLSYCYRRCQSDSDCPEQTECREPTDGYDFEGKVCE